MEEEKHIINDSTENLAGSRIPTTSYFETVWSKELKLLQYFYSWNSPSVKIRSLDKLSRQDKLAISRHKKKLMIQLGLLKEQKEVKIIYRSFCPTAFYSDLAIEKKNTFHTDISRHDKDDCVLWTKEKAELIKQYDELKTKRDNELDKIEYKIMERP